MTIDEVQSLLRERLQDGLPGFEAQLPLAPRPRAGWRDGYSPEAPRLAAGLLLVFPKEDRAHLLLTVRGPSLSTHAAQVSLPGGRVEPGESIERAALREAHEETGVDPALVQVLGTLTPLHIPISGHLLHPVLGITSRTPEFSPARHEVERILEVPLEHLLDTTRLRHRTLVHEAVEYEVPHFWLDGEQVWGATAMILAEFRSLLSRQGGNPRLT